MQNNRFEINSQTDKYCAVSMVEIIMSLKGPYLSMVSIQSSHAPSGFENVKEYTKCFSGNISDMVNLGFLTTYLALSSSPNLSFCFSSKQ